VRRRSSRSLMYEGDQGCPVVSCSPALAIIRYRGHLPVPAVASPPRSSSRSWRPPRSAKSPAISALCFAVKVCTRHISRVARSRATRRVGRPRTEARPKAHTTRSECKALRFKKVSLLLGLALPASDATEDSRNDSVPTRSVGQSSRRARA
jgi:hypothetical protein